MREKTKKKVKLCVTNHMFYKIVLDDHNNYNIWQSYSSKVNFDWSSIFLDYSLSSRLELRDCFSQSWKVKWILQYSLYLSFQLVDIFKSFCFPLINPTLDCIPKEVIKIVESLVWYLPYGTAQKTRMNVKDGNQLY